MENMLGVVSNFVYILDALGRGLAKRQSVFIADTQKHTNFAGKFRQVELHEQNNAHVQDTARDTGTVTRTRHRSVAEVVDSQPSSPTPQSCASSRTSTIQHLSPRYGDGEFNDSNTTTLEATGNKALKCYQGVQKMTLVVGSGFGSGVEGRSSLSTPSVDLWLREREALLCAYLRLISQSRKPFPWGV